MNTAPVAVVIPAYNAASLLDRCLESVVHQTTPVQEIWIVNDGSVDATAEIIKSWEERDCRVHAIHQVNLGLAAARNSGIVATTAKWIAFLDHDDTWMPNKVERILEIQKRDPEAAVLYHDALRPDGTRYLADKGATEGNIFDNLIRSFFILPSTAVIRRDVLTGIGMFNVRRRFAEDYDLFLRISRNYRFLLLNEPLTLYDQQPTSLTRNTLAMMTVEIALFEELIAGQLVGKLTGPQVRLAREKLARRYYSCSYELRSIDTRKSWHALSQSLRLRPGSLATWKLAVANLRYALAHIP